ncbi:MAG: hypothetical protein FD180_445 [Planctomycetota bacterium]|nr:MAG: hypothetical protein FD180_445 [Planctomycetota bacterium]
MKRALIVLLLLAGCDKPKPATPSASAGPTSADSAPYSAARTRFLHCLSEFEAHAWDLEGSVRRKVLLELEDAGAGIVAAKGRPAELPTRALFLATKRVTDEASKFSQLMNAQESRGRLPETGLPWPYEYKEAAALGRCLLTEARLGTTDKRQSFAALAALVAVIETLSVDGPVSDVRDAFTRLYSASNRMFADHKDLTPAEKVALNSLVRNRYEDLPATLVQLRALRHQLEEFASGK